MAGRATTSSPASTPPTPCTVRCSRSASRAVAPDVRETGEGRDVRPVPAVRGLGPVRPYPESDTITSSGLISAGRRTTAPRRAPRPTEVLDHDVRGDHEPSEELSPVLGLHVERQAPHPRVRFA